jgi:signal transduction histidine kinase
LPGSNRLLLYALRCLAVLLALAGLSQARGQVVTLTRAQVSTGGAAAAPVTLPHEWQNSFPRFGGVAEYRLQFDVPAGEDLLAVYVPRACSNLEVVVNGQLVGSGGRMTPPYAANCYYPSLFPLPRPLLREGTNDLRIRVAGYPAGEASSRQRSSGLSAVQVGPMAQLRPDYDSQRFWNITVSQIIATVLTGLGLALLGLWLARRRDRYMLFFGLFAIGWAALTTRLFVQHTGPSHHATEVLIGFAFFPVVSCAMLFLMRLLGRAWRWMDIGLALQALAVLLVLCAVPPGRLLDASTVLYAAGGLEFLACVAAFLVLSWRTHRQDFWLVGGVLLQSSAFLGLELLQQAELLPLPRVHFVHFAMPLVFAVVAVRLIQLFVRAVQRAETLNLELEQRVREKSREIERNWQHIAQLQTAQAAQDERRRIASDLHDDLGAQLLTIVQASQRGGEPERIAGMARQAMEEMRLSVRGMTGHVTAAEEALADWRAETVTRIVDAGLQVRWEAQEPPSGLILPARLHVQVTRILREAVSNAIRHSGGSCCAVQIAFEPDGLRLQVEDDGRGLPAGTGARGSGLPNIERRVRLLGGEHAFDAAPGGGTRLVVRIPLAAALSPQEVP